MRWDRARESAPALPALAGAATFAAMSTLAEIEGAIEKLPPPDQRVNVYADRIEAVN
jgi:hypothetical protein